MPSNIKNSRHAIVKQSSYTRNGITSRSGAIQTREDEQLHIGVAKNHIPNEAIPEIWQLQRSRKLPIISELSPIVNWLFTETNSLFILIHDNNGTPCSWMRTHCRKRSMHSQTTHHEIRNLGRNTRIPAHQMNQDGHAQNTNCQSFVRKQCMDFSASIMEDSTIVTDDNDDKPGAWSRMHCRRV
jgi:hypothetical protein